MRSLPLSKGGKLKQIGVEDEKMRRLTVKVCPTKLKRHYTTADFGKKEFWEKKYSHGNAVEEWFAHSSRIFPKLEILLHQNGFLDKEMYCAHLGCGLSKLGFHLVERFEKMHVVNMDSSQTALKLLERAFEDNEWKSQVSYELLDLLDPSSVRRWNSVFDICIDKGTLDAIEFAKKEAIFLQNVSDMLKPGGLYIQISDSPPELRDSLLCSRLWERVSYATLEAFESDRELFLYCCQSQLSKV